MNRFLRSIGAALFLLSLSGCASYISGGPLIRPGEPTGIIEVVNRSRLPVTAVLISNCNHSTYGLNRLPQGMAIQSGRSYRFTVSAGCWDVLAGRAGAEARQRMQVRAGGGVRYTVHD
ncbi:lipoprotein [Hyphobacterium indicum]|uniref:hypothetical protein n=1 Tax=Hyphobacterium indicum TaxID=2162714 RepID=UPI000D647DB5|nr:hypothetical protein [Hyphobacterium indicum]|tara:strand:- start:697 stop:1050 length:354 start_codon:yes stop_codon:yes gene_type:complete